MPISPVIEWNVCGLDSDDETDDDDGSEAAVAAAGVASALGAPPLLLLLRLLDFCLFPLSARRTILANRRFISFTL